MPLSMSRTLITAAGSLLTVSDESTLRSEIKMVATRTALDQAVTQAKQGPVMFKAAICALIVLLTFVAFVKLADWPPLNTWETRSKQ